MSVRLRPHHLLCMLAYSGKGYTDAFVANYDAVMARLNDREEIVIVSGPDDICSALLCEPDCHCHNQSILARDADAAAEVSRCLGRPIAEGETLVVDHATLGLLHAGFHDGSIRTACGAYADSAACEWHDLCSAVAKDGFRNAKLNPRHA
jgi:uncharacterized protein